MRLNGVLNRMRGNGGAWKRVCALGIVVLGMPGAAVASDPWIKPTPEELSMTSVPGHPNVPAIYLFREQITKDDYHVVQHYERIKVLTEKGKAYANVELGFANFTGYSESGGENKTIEDISGRTIHSDGTVIPFTGKPYTKTTEKGDNYKAQERVFTLPDVEVGSIIEYRYATRYADNWFEEPQWYIQNALFTRAAHYAWYPTGQPLHDSDGNTMSTITWFPLLPNGVTLVQKQNPRIYEVTLSDVPPLPEEDYMPPLKSYTYRVLFSFSQYRSRDEYWKGEGKRWSKNANTFIGPDKALTAATQGITAGANTEDEKLRKIYAAVMNLENTDYTRDRGAKEDKAAGLKQIKTAIDVLKHERGNSAELSYLFIGMARAAGMKAYAMRVPNRANHIFTTDWLNTYSQLVNTVAIVNVDGKERFFAPGERYTPYGHLEWEYTIVQGMRQTEAGTDFGFTPEEDYKQTKTARVANLTMAEDGSVTGKIDMTYEGSTALRWRQRALTGDEEGLRQELKTSLQEMLPKTLEVTVTTIDNLKDYEKPLTASFKTTGTLGTSAGKRLLLPVDIFEAGAGVTFPQEKRDWPVYFHYPQTVVDAMRINLPSNMVVEAVPAASKVLMNGLASYTLTTESGPTNVTVRRSYVFGGVIVPVKMYPELRTFYSQFGTKDQESIVLKAGAPVTVKAAVTPPGN